MNTPARFLQDAFYRLFNGIVLLLGGMKTPQRSYAIATLLGNMRTHFGYIGAGWSREKYLETITSVFPDIRSPEAKQLLKAYWENHQKRFMELFRQYCNDCPPESYFPTEEARQFESWRESNQIIL